MPGFSFKNRKGFKTWQVDAGVFVQPLDIEERKRFHINQVKSLKGRWFVTPIPGEEHFVGALYTLFSHIILPTHKLSHLWKRPLTFSGVGIDAIAVDDEDKEFDSQIMKLKNTYV